MQLRATLSQALTKATTVMNNQIPETTAERQPSNNESASPPNFNVQNEFPSGNATATVTITQTATTSTNEEVLPLTLRARPNVTW